MNCEIWKQTFKEEEDDEGHDPKTKHRIVSSHSSVVVWCGVLAFEENLGL